jgi:hypothetical protein
VFDALIVAVSVIVLIVLLVMFLRPLLSIGFRDTLYASRKILMTEDEKARRASRSKEEILEEQLNKQLERAVMTQDDKYIKTMVDVITSQPKRQDTKKNGNDVRAR